MNYLSLFLRYFGFILEIIIIQSISTVKDKRFATKKEQQQQKIQTEIYQKNINNDQIEQALNMKLSEDQDNQQYEQLEKQIQVQQQNEAQQQEEEEQQGFEEMRQQIDIQNERQVEQNMQQYREKQNNRGVCYLSRIPPYMKPNYIRKLLTSYMIERIYLLPESDFVRKNRIKRGGNKKICFREGWIEFGDKRMAKLAAMTLNGQKMVPKKGSFYSEDIWNLKYLPKFKWHHLTERLAHQERLKKQRLKVELEMERKVDQFYSEKLSKSKQIEKIIHSKTLKGRSVGNNISRQFLQFKKVDQIQDQ